MEGTRQRMVQAAAVLFRENGYEGTGFRDVVARAGTARGVIYHHFPQGKAELGVEVAGWTGDLIAAAITEACQGPPRDALATVVGLVETWLVGGDLPPGCPVASVALAPSDDDGRLRAAADAAFARWAAPVEDCLVREGVDRARAARFAVTVVSAVEGAVVLCRARRSTEPLRAVAATLEDLLDALTA